MDKHRGERSVERFGDRPGDRSGDGGRHSRMPSRWSSGSPTNQHHRFPRGGGGEGFSGGRYHTYRAQPELPPAGGGGGPGFRGGQGFRDGPGGFGGHQMPMGGQKRGFAGRGGSPEYGEGKKFAKLFIGSVPKTATEEDIRPLFEEHGDVIEVALIKEKRTGQQQGQDVFSFSGKKKEICRSFCIRQSYQEMVVHPVAYCWKFEMHLSYS